jgi:hypothetical protein
MTKLEDFELKKIERIKECLLLPPEERTDKILSDLVNYTKVTILTHLRILPSLNT